MTGWHAPCEQDAWAQSDNWETFILKRTLFYRGCALPVVCKLVFYLYCTLIFENWVQHWALCAFPGASEHGQGPGDEAESALTHPCQQAVSYMLTVSFSVSPSHLQFGILPEVEIGEWQMGGGVMRKSLIMFCHQLLNSLLQQVSFFWAFLW